MLYGVPLGILLSLVHQSAAEAWVSQAVREKDKPASKYPFSCKVVTGFLPVSLLEENILRRLLFSLSGCIFRSPGACLTKYPWSTSAMPQLSHLQYMAGLQAAGRFAHKHELGIKVFLLSAESNRRLKKSLPFSMCALPLSYRLSREGFEPSTAHFP